jgi:uncharacterized protein (TIGR03435 family)
MIRQLLAAGGLGVLAASYLLAQAKTFEIADVHTSAPGTRQMDGGFMPGGRVELRGATMVNLVAAAYGVDDEEFVVGGPNWLNTNRYDIIAKAPAGAVSEEKLQGMLLALLEQRFHLIAHKDKREKPSFALTARKGVKLEPAPKSDKAKIDTFTGDPALNQHYQFTAVTMELLAAELTDLARNFVPHPVVDETHLKGAFNFRLEWMGINIYRRAKANPDGPPAVGLVEALDQIGLHVEAANRPTDVIVVDSVNETPTPNAENVSARIPKFPDEFEVAEVRPAHPVSPPPARPLPPTGITRNENGRVQILSATLSGLLTHAMQVEPRMLVGAPKWMDEDRFDVIAKTSAADLPDDVFGGMLKKVLIEKFHLEMHAEEQSLPVYVLVPGRAPKLMATDGSSRADCHIENTDRRYYVCRNTTMAQFVDGLPGVASAYVYRPVIDSTGLTGAYDFRLHWTPKGLLSQAGTGDVASTPVEELTLYEAVDKQLGLKLDMQKRPVPVVVIDKVERLPEAR